jgi:hypothetical protein
VLTAGSTAAVYKARQQINKKALDRLLGQLATERSLTLSQIQNFGANVTRLVLPESIKAILARHLENPLVVVHDAASSRIPWETLIIDDKFPALEAGLAHRYEAEELAIAKWLEERQRKSTLQLLLIVNPTRDLTSAEAEGNRIRSIFDKLGPAVSVRDMRGEKARKEEVLRCRLDRLHINPDGSADRHAVVTGTTRHISRVSTGDQRLGGCACSIDAGAAEELAFDHSHLLTSSYETSRQRWARLPSLNDDGVVIVHWLFFPLRAESIWPFEANCLVLIPRRSQDRASTRAGLRLRSDQTLPATALA